MGLYICCGLRLFDHAMFMHRQFFKIYLTLSIAALLAGGCSSTPQEKEKKEKEKAVSTLRIHIEVPPSDFSIAVMVNREPPVSLTIDKEPFLTEANVVEARIVEVMGGFDLQIQFDHRGTLLLEEYTTSNPRRRLAIFGQFGNKPGEGRWLAGPEILRRITSGTLTFTPDASRAEVERIVLGLNNVAKQAKEKNKW